MPRSFNAAPMSCSLPSVAREVAAAGHEIGNHSDTHPLLALRTPRLHPSRVGFRSRARRPIRHRRLAPLFPSPTVRVGLVFSRRAAATLASRRDVEHHCVRLEIADRRRRRPLAPWRGPRRDSLLTRWPSPRASPRHRCHASSRARTSAEIGGPRFPFRKGDRHSMSHEELTARVRAVIAATQHLPPEKITPDRHP